MSQFSKDELSFVNKLPEQVEIECPVCLNILANPHLVSCCGHDFCESCIERVKASNGACPMCKERSFQALVNKERRRIINGLQVYCTNKENGCEWKGELKNLSTHLNKRKREGECQYEVVKCRFRKCEERNQRQHLKHHEDNECLQRRFECQYCNTRDTYHSITYEEHYKKCSKYPSLLVYCTNNEKGCEWIGELKNLPTHLNKGEREGECQYKEVKCRYRKCQQKCHRQKLDHHERNECMLEGNSYSYS